MSRHERAVVVAAVIGMLLFAAWLRDVWLDCNASGGTLVKNFVGWPVCINARPEKP